MSHERIWGFLSSRYTNFLIIIIIIITVHYHCTHIIQP